MNSPSHAGIVEAKDATNRHDKKTKTTNKSKLWSDLPRRLITICIGFPFVWFMLSHRLTSTIFFMGAHGLSLWEFTMLEPISISYSDEKPKPASSSIGRLKEFFFRFIYCLLSVLLAVLTRKSDAIFQLLLCCISGILVTCERRHWALGFIVVTIPFRVWIQIAPHDFTSTISILLVVWNCDTGALIVGRLTNSLGWSRLPVPVWIHQISPAKSIEGFFGGILGGTWTAISLVPFLIRITNLHRTDDFEELWGSFRNRLWLGMALSILAILGDLFESAIKRQSHSKDSGSILPGHGGVLDRFDSSLLAIVLYHCLLQ